MWINVIRKIAGDVQDALCTPGEEDDQFSSVAARHLNKMPPVDDSSAFLNEMMSLRAYPKQSYPNAGFGKHALTILRTSEFFIDVYLWPRDSQLSIHNHNFLGAFKPIYGHTIETRYSFVVRKSIADGITTGELIEREASQLSGECAIPLYDGDACIHRTEHLSSPTITLCLRTPTRPQTDYIYFSNGLRLVMKGISGSFGGFVTTLGKSSWSEEKADLVSERLAQLPPIDVALFGFHYCDYLGFSVEVRDSLKSIAIRHLQASLPGFPEYVGEFL